MPQVVTLGPLAMATDRMLAIGAIWAFLLLMMLIGQQRRQRQAASRAAWIAIAAGLAVARLAYVVLNWTAFAADWTAIIAFWQGGFELWPGVIAAGIALLLALRDNRMLVRALVALAVCAFGLSATQALLLRQPSRPLPPVAALHRLDGKTVRLDSYRGKPMIINLWATWCPPCRRELPMLAAIAKTSPVPILLIDQGEDAASVRAFLSQQNIPADAVLLDSAGSLSAALGSGVFPTTLFVDANGSIVTSHIGEISRAALLAQRTQIQKDKP